MWRRRPPAHSKRMSGTQLNDLSTFSQALVTLVANTAQSVVVVKSAAHRTTSGIRVGENLIAVASHSLRREERVTIQTATGSEAVASILGRDPGIDLAILKADGLAGKPATPADPAALRAGALAVVVGMTADVGPTASLGILGAVGPARRNWRGGTLDHFFRLDVNLYPSQSGAAVVNAAGELLGMATPALSRHSTVAVPTTTIERICKELAEQGRIRHGYLGVGVQPVLLPESIRSSQTGVGKTGLIVLSVESASPAERSGVQLGDILLELNSQPLADIDDLQNALRGNVIGTPVKLRLLRGGQRAELETTILERGRQN